MCSRTTDSAKVSLTPRQPGGRLAEESREEASVGPGQAWALGRFAPLRAGERRGEGPADGRGGREVVRPARRGRAG